MPESCNSRSLSWLVNSCIRKSPSHVDIPIQSHTHSRPVTTPDSDPDPSPISSLPDDLLLACLARAPLPSLPSISAASRRFSLLLSTPHYFSLRRSLTPLAPALLSLSLSSSDLTVAALNQSGPATWHIPFSSASPSFVALDNLVFVISPRSSLKLDTWTSRISPISPPSTSRKKFAAAALNGRIYLVGGSTAVEVYDPESDAWRIATQSPTRRYGCVAAAAGDFLYVIGGVGVGEGVDARAAAAASGTMEAYHVRAGVWVKGGSRAVPGGACVVGACGVGPSLYVVASNGAEVTFWRWEWRQRRRGEWVPLAAPPAVQGTVGLGIRVRVRVSCCEVGEGRMACAVHVRGRGHDGDFGDGDGVVLVYDVASGEWSRGPDLPVGSRRAGLVCVER